MEPHGLAELREVLPIPLPPHPARRALRLAARISQNDLGRVIGVSGVAVCRYESGAREPRGVIRERYAAALEELRRG